MTIVYKIAVWLFVIYSLNLNAAASAAPQETKRIFARNALNVGGCYHNGSVFAETSIVPTVEPCLLCKCYSKNLVCVRRVCPEQPIPPPRGCVLIHKNGMCCPYLSCSKYHVTFYKNYDRRQHGEDYNKVGHSEKKHVSGKNRRSDDESEQIVDESGVCIEDGTIYRSGSAMSSSSLCSYCYCIAGKPKCVKPKCMLSQPGCEPIYMESSSCCPIRYDCKNSNSTGLDINQVQEDFQRTNNKHYMRNNKRTHRSNGCFVDSYYYHEGQKLPMDQKRPCDVCYCIKGIRKCAPKQCAPAIRGCIPKVPRGDCCPISYDCKNAGKVKARELAQSKDDSFDLLSLLFGPDDPSEDSAELKDEHEEIKEIVQSTTLVPFKALGTTERSFFDFLRAGLEIIDANEDPINNILSHQANRTEDVEVENLNSSDEIVVTIAPRETSIEAVKILEITSTTPVPTKQTSPTTVRTTTVAVKTTQKPKPTTRQPTTTKRTEKPTTKIVPTTIKPSTTTTKVAPTKTTVKITTQTPTTTKKPVPVTTRKPATIKQVITTSKPATTEKPKINPTTKIIPTTTSAPKISTTTVQQKTTPKPQRTNQSSSEIITEEVKVPTKLPTIVSSTQSPIPMTTIKSQHVTTENIISAFFSGLSSIFDEQKKNEQIVGSKYALTPQPPINTLIMSKQPSLNSNPAIIDQDYVYDYNEPTLPPSLPNLKIIPFLPADAVNNVNYFKPNLESRITSNYPTITEKYDVYGSIIRSDLETDPTRLDYGGGYSNFNKDSQYNIYGSGLADPPLAVKGQTSDQLTETYDASLKGQDNTKQTGNGNGNGNSHVRYNTKFIRDKYDTVDYDFNPNEKIDKFEGELKYIPHSYEPNYNEYGKYPGNAGYPGASFEHDKYYTYSDKYDVAPDNTYIDKKPGFFSPPTKTEGGFIPKDSVKEDYYYNPGIEITTSEPGQIFDVNVLPPFKTAIYSDTPHTLHSLMEQKEKVNQIKNKTDDVEKKNNSRVTTSAPHVFAPQFVPHTTNQTNKNSSTINSSTNATEKDSKENNILPNVFNYLFTAESGGDINDNALHADKTTNDTIPEFKNISLNFPSFDDWLSEQNNKTNLTTKESANLPQQPSTVETTKVQSASEIVSPKTTRTPTTARVPITKPTTKRPVKINTTTQKPTTTTRRPTITTTTVMSTTVNNIKQEVKYPVHSYVDPSIQEQTKAPVFNNQNKITNFDQLPQHHSEGATEISAKPTLPNMNGLLKLAGCNIYGRMYRVGKIIAELSSPCLECKCTEIGVSCTPLKC